MKYDVLHLPGVKPAGCGEYYVESRLSDDHEPGDQITIQCGRCARVGVLEVRGRLEGLA